MASQKTWDPLRGDYYRIVVGPNGARRKDYDHPTPQEAVYTQRPPARPNPEPQGPPPIRDGFSARGANPVFAASHLRGGTSNPNSVFSTPQTLNSARQNQVSYDQAPQGQAPQGQAPQGQAPQGQASQGRASRGPVPQGQAYRQNPSGGTTYPSRAQGQGSGSFQIPSQQQNMRSTSLSSNPYGVPAVNQSYPSAIPVLTGAIQPTKAAAVNIQSTKGSKAPAIQQRFPAHAQGNPVAHKKQAPNEGRHPTQQTGTHTPTHAASDFLSTSVGKTAGHAVNMQRRDTQTYRSQLDLIESTEQLNLNSYSTAATTPTLTTPPRADLNRSRRLSSTTSGTLSNQLPHDHRMASNPRQFFKKGRVFSYYHIEQASQMAPSTRSSQFSSNLYFSPVGLSGYRAYHNFRRFIIVKVDLQVNQSFAVPIATYGGRGALKPSIDPHAHAIAYSGGRAPPLRAGEEISKDPIKINLASPTDKFDPMSRINFRKVVHIDHGWEVKNLGMVDDTSLPKLNSYYRQYADA